MRSPAFPSSSILRKEALQANPRPPATSPKTASFTAFPTLLANCVNSTGGSAGDGSPCGLLFSIATPPGGSAPADTMTAALRIAQNPGNNVTEIFGQTKADTYFQPALTAAPNDWTLSLTYMVATPSISPATGSYVGAQEVTISDSTAGSKIYYTTDGTVPTSSSTPYTGPLSIATSSTVQAIAVLLGSPSAVASSTLTITSPPSSPHHRHRHRPLQLRRLQLRRLRRRRRRS